MIKRNIFLGTILFLICIAESLFGKGFTAPKDSIAAKSSTIQFIFCSDVHLGLTRPAFRNQTNVSSADVNAAMIAQMNELSSGYLPNDGGVCSGEKVGGIEGVIITGDICNRQEPEAQSASLSWKQFEDDYIGKLHLLNNAGNKTRLLLTPGNHDITNAIGYHKPMQPLVDNASMVGMYNLMMQPAIAKTANNFNFHNDKIHYSVNMGGIHLMFVSAWPDSAERVWMQQDLQKIPGTMPTFIFTHSDPDPEARFFQNPNGDHSINANDKFENLVEEMFKGGVSSKDNTIIEQRGLVAFLQAHPNIKAYFHGHTNYAEFYDWKGPDNTISLPCFRADSPMKGRVSAKDETKVSFNVVSIDTEKKLMTVRECLWNTHPEETSQKVTWGILRTISF